MQRLARRSEGARNARRAVRRSAMVRIADGSRASLLAAACAARRFLDRPGRPAAEHRQAVACGIPTYACSRATSSRIRSSLALGAFDLSKAIVLLLPLLMIVLSFDVLSAERDAGRLGLTLAQGADLRRLFWQRLSIRCGLVIIGSRAAARGSGIVVQRRGTAPLSDRLPGVRAVGRMRRALRRALARDHRRTSRAGIGSGESNIVQLLLCWAGADADRSGSGHCIGGGDLSAALAARVPGGGASDRDRNGARRRRHREAASSSIIRSWSSTTRARCRHTFAPRSS